VEPSTGSASGADFIAETVLLSVTLETLFPNDRLEAASVTKGLSGLIQEHGYWDGAPIGSPSDRPTSSAHPAAGRR